MAAFLPYILLSALYLGIEAQQSPRNISLGSSLTPTGNSSWLSRSGLYAFGFYQQGNGYVVGIFIAGIPEKTLVWIANRDSPVVPGNSSLVLSREGRLIVQQTEGQQLFTVGNPSESISSASMLDSGNFVLYNSDKKIIWQSFQHPMNTLLPGQQLSTEQELVSSVSETDDSSGIYRLKMQADGNLVQYPVGTTDVGRYAYYATMTFGQNITLNLEDDGHLYLLNSSLDNIKNLYDGGHPKIRTIYLMKIDVDGLFRLYSHRLDPGNWSILWESSTDKCDPKGFCGFNSFCTRMDNVVQCKCLDGFDFVTPGNWSLGCERNFTAESCNSRDVNVKYTIRSLENTVWDDNSFSVLETSTKEDCEKVCLEDCNCEAAFYKNGQCKKQRLPLTYGKRTADSNIALVKVGREKAPKQSWKWKLGVGLAVPLLLASILICLCCRRQKRINSLGVVKDKIPGAKRLGLSKERNDDLPFFSLSSIKIATDDFSDTKKLGQGGFGPVYKGKLFNGQEIAVKRLLRLSGHGIEQFKNEVILISKLQHRNLVRLLGYCNQGEERLLVYEYQPNKSLDSILFDATKRALLDWKTRVNIIQGIAQGLLYLHKYSRLKIIHRDLKTSNILLDNEMNPKISDFGTARIFQDHDTRANTKTIVGTYGYMSPEYAMDGLFSEKSDVFSFGVMVLEIISGKKNTSFYHPDRDLNLLGYAWDLWKEGRVSDFADPTIAETFSISPGLQYVHIGLLCVQENAADRPIILDVVTMLMSESTALPAPKQPAFSAIVSLHNDNCSENPQPCSINNVTLSDVQGR